MKQIYLKFSMLLLCLVVGLSSAWAIDITLATGTFNGKNATYTSGWSTTGTGTGRTDCVIIGKDENITSPSIDFSQYDEVKITFTGRRFGTLSGSKATVEATVNGTSLGSIDISATSVGAVSGNICYKTNVANLGNNPVVFTCTNATSAGSTHGAGIGSITIIGVKNNTEAYTVTFDAGENGTCTTSSLTETSAGSGVTLPSATANDGYVFDGWTATQGNLTPDEGCTADKTYHPSANCTLYAVYSQPGKPFTLVFEETGTDGDSSVKYDTSDLSEMFKEGSDYVSSISNLSNVYPAQTGRGAKVGTSKANGTLTINLGKAVTLGMIVVECAGYSKDEVGGFTINGTNFSSTTYAANGFEELTYNTKGPISAITIATQSKRGYVKSIKVYPEGSYVNLNISDKCTDGTKYYATFSSSKAFIVPADVTVSEVGVTDEKLNVASYAEGATVPANTGVMVSSATAGVKYFEVTTGGTSVLGEDNSLKPSGDNGINSTDVDNVNYTYYRLTMHNGTQIGFWWGAAEGRGFDLGPNKAYLQVKKSASHDEDEDDLVKSFWIANEETVISNVNANTNDNDAIYNLNGQRVNTVTKGMYIKNGKKYLVK